MRIHELDIFRDFADEVVCGDKTFEIRKDDRNFYVGDFIRFVAVDENCFKIEHPINSRFYKITYILGGYELMDDYVVLAIKRMDVNIN